MRSWWWLCAVCVLVSGCEPQTPPVSPEATPSKAERAREKQDAAFAAWLKGVRNEAAQKGISKRTLDNTLVGIYHNDRVIQLDRKQPESKLTLEEYLEKVINEQRIRRGRELYAEHRALLDAVSAKYGVPSQYIVALWGIETSYGDNTGGFSVIEALATLAYDGRRSDYFRGELMNALAIIDASHIDADAMNGSWAGAMGQCQFMPSSFLNFAEDYNNDGKRDIWNTEADIFASIANYLQRSGWSDDKQKNFDVILKWNRSRYFATAVMQLADSIAQ